MSPLKSTSGPKLRNWELQGVDSVYASLVFWQKHKFNWKHYSFGHSLVIGLSQEIHNVLSQNMYYFPWGSLWNRKRCQGPQRWRKSDSGCSSGGSEMVPPVTKSLSYGYANDLLCDTGKLPSLISLSLFTCTIVIVLMWTTVIKDQIIQNVYKVLKWLLSTQWGLSNKRYLRLLVANVILSWILSRIKTQQSPEYVLKIMSHLKSI